jgi:hypothetical protein
MVPWVRRKVGKYSAIRYYALPGNGKSMLIECPKDGENSVRTMGETDHGRAVIERNLHRGAYLPKGPSESGMGANLKKEVVTF